MPFYSTKPGPPQFPSGIAEAIRHAKTAPHLRLPLSEAVYEARLPTDFAIETREWLKRKELYFRMREIDRDDIAEIESVLAGPAPLTARLLVNAVVYGLQHKFSTFGSTGGLKFASV